MRGTSRTHTLESLYMETQRREAIPKDIRKDLTADLACLLEINKLKQVERVLYCEGVNRTKTTNKE